MRLFLLGLAMRDYSHDYAPLHAALFKMRAKRVSTRIWIVSVFGPDIEAFNRLAHLTARGDEMLVVETSGRECLDILRRGAFPEPMPVMDAA